jgi:hypothetical protein
MHVRVPLVLALLAGPVATPAAPAEPGAGARPASATAPRGGALAVGGFVGYETDDLSGLSLRLDGELPFTALAPQLDLSLVGSIGFSRLTDEQGVLDFSANILKVVPAARFSFAVQPKLTLFADGGLGLYYSSWTIENTRFGGQTDDGELGIVMRLGAGAWYAVNPNARVGAMIELDPYFGDVILEADQTTFLIQVGAMFTL